MEETFKKLVEEGKNNVDNLIQWMQDSKLVESTKASEEKARQLFADVSNKSNVEFKKFHEIVVKLAEEQKKSVEDLCSKLADEGSKFMSAAVVAGQAGAKAAASAFRDAMKK